MSIAPKTPELLPVWCCLSLTTCALLLEPRRKCVGRAQDCRGVASAVSAVAEARQVHTAALGSAPGSQRREVCWTRHLHWGAGQGVDATCRHAAAGGIYLGAQAHAQLNNVQNCVADKLQLSAMSCHCTLAVVLIEPYSPAHQLPLRQSLQLTSCGSWPTTR